MSVALGATIYLTTLLQRYRLKVLRTFFASKNPNSKPKSALLYDNMAGLPKKNNKKDKMRFQNQKREYTREQKKSTLAIRINTIDVLKKKKKRRNVSKIMCFNYNKKDHFANNCTRPKN